MGLSATVSRLVANAVFLEASNWFAERFGRKRFLMFSIMVFTAASFACGVAPTLPLVLLARAVQGVGGGALQPIAQAILIESFPPEKQGQALGLYALGVVLAPVIGPALGGYLTDAISWRWAFYINVPIGCWLYSCKVVSSRTPLYQERQARQIRRCRFRAAWFVGRLHAVRPR